jgi:hypothetical protein
MKVFSRGTQPNQLFAKAEGTDNAVTTITIAANANEFWALDHVTFSGNVTPDANVTLTITFGSTVVFKHFITEGGVGPVPLGGLATGTKNEAVTIESSAPGSSKKINLSVAYR